MARITATRRIEWDAAHRVLRHESKCSTVHGHRYVAEIECDAPKLDDVGRVIDFGVVKELVGGWVDENFDHTTLVNAADVGLRLMVEEDHVRRGKRAPFVFDGEPTAENIAAKLAEVAAHLLRPFDIGVCRVRVYETPNCYAEWTP